MKAVPVPLTRIAKHLSPGKTWHDPGYQGPAGLYVVRGFGGDNHPPMFQVTRIRKEVLPRTEDVSLPFMTLEGAEQFARRMAEGAPEKERFA